MIKFFRSFRKNLLNEGNTTKYLKYAIGEIILVVIGILLALQINSWNEDRKMRAAEQEILQNLKNELTSNKEKLSFYLSKHEKGYKDGLYLMSLFHTDITTIAASILDSTLGSIEETWTFESNDGIIKSLIASGKIDIIQNTELKALVTSFDGAVIDATQESSNIRQLLHERLWPKTDGKLNIKNRIRTYTGFKDYPKGTYASDYAWFFSNREMDDVTSNITSWYNTVLNDEKELMQTIDKMIALVEKEIKYSK